MQHHGSFPSVQTAKWICLPAMLAVLLATSAVGSTPETFAQLELDPSKEDVWYLGEGLTEGDYFSYEMCSFKINNCDIRFDMTLWFKETTDEGRHFKVLVEDRGKAYLGDMWVGKWTPEPLKRDNHIDRYVQAYKTGIAWLVQLTTKDDPGAFWEPTWGESAAIGGGDVNPSGEATIQVPAGEFETQKIFWSFTRDNKIWIDPGLPYPVKALVWLPSTSGSNPKLYDYTLTDYGNTKEMPPFMDVDGAITSKAELVGEDCPPFEDVVRKEKKNTNTGSMVIHYRWAPEQPVQGCPMTISIDFTKKGAGGGILTDVRFHRNLHFDFVRVDEGGQIERSLAEEKVGRTTMFNPQGQYRSTFTVSAEPGTHTYAVVVYGTGQEGTLPDPALNGLVKFDLTVRASPENSLEIPDWISDSAKWWAQGKIKDQSFINGIEFMIKEDIIVLPESAVSQESNQPASEIPDWIKRNAGWWSSGKVGDKSFVNGLQWMIKNGVIVI